MRRPAPTRTRAKAIAVPAALDPSIAAWPLGLLALASAVALAR